MSVDQSSASVEYKMCENCQYSVPRSELIDGECVYCKHDIQNPMWR